MKKLVKLALIVGGIAFAAKFVAAKKSEWRGLTESEVREKLDPWLAGRVSDEKRSTIADIVVSKMRERGVLREEGEPSAPTDSGGAGEGPDSGDSETGDFETDAEGDADSEDNTESV
ncbi:hypothetical protein BMS3Abin02_02142 [bacterium BMS3Abin02]|nr:hypothetical protein BMS3Abin02_02142 [bacterium BMS3Abin02]GBE20991.1 hypothetical protein BMS3Bbin01_00332 [bacterium BMS3Bbin01]HDH26162.1 hypothetical protein [Actinomycetota bacterium]HDK44952.1 hypothetical protein [Actinomycetota bacterium]